MEDQGVIEALLRQPSAFRAWLERNPDAELVPLSHLRCPIACWLQDETGGRTVQVYYGGVLTAQWKTVPMPDWAGEFARAFDDLFAGGGGPHHARALRILDDVFLSVLGAL
jgi:hypothetical protein